MNSLRIGTERIMTRNICALVNCTQNVCMPNESKYNDTEKQSLRIAPKRKYIKLWSTESDVK